MRWLMIALYVSVALLVAVSAGMARHVWRAHKQAEKQQAEQVEARQTEEESEIPTEEGQ